MRLSLFLLTRKPSWRKGKRATAVRVWRPLAKKSTTNQRYAISYSWFIVTMTFSSFSTLILLVGSCDL